MVNMARASVSDFFDGYSHDFNAIYGKNNSSFDKIINRIFRKSMRLRYVKSLEGCEPIKGASVLDVGCGPGHYSVALGLKQAGRVLGIDFADGMIELARTHAEKAGVSSRCEFVAADFMTYPFKGKFDYCIVMGFMDYMKDARSVVERVLSLARSKAFFSFPDAAGILAWQRTLRYRRRCDLFLYSRDQIESLLREVGCRKTSVEKISRDFFVTVTK